jgi:hypothetical protein
MQRTFCVMPKSPRHTSPRSGTRRFLLLIQRAERSGGEGRKIVVCQVIGQGNALDYYASKLLPLLFGEPLELVENLSHCLRHAGNIRSYEELGKWAKRFGLIVPQGMIPASARREQVQPAPANAHIFCTVRSP